MFGSAIGWLKGLSIVGKSVLGVATLGTVGIVAATPNQPDTTQTKINGDSIRNAPVTTTKEVVEEVEIDFSSKTEENSSMNQGETSLKTNGLKGLKTLKYSVTYVDGKETTKLLIDEKVVREPVDEITYVGTYVKPAAPPVPRCDENYSGGCVPVVSYDLDCADIGFRVYVVGYDRHGFDGRDNDGVGCESY